MFDPNSWKAIFGHFPLFLNGLLTTIEMALVGFCIAFVLGVMLGLFATGRNKAFRVVSRVYVEFFQNTPLMLQALFLFYALVFSGVQGFTPVICGMVALGLYHGAYFSEVFRAGVTSIPYGQSEAAYSQGFTYLQTMRHVVLPQTIKIILPPMVTQIVALIKNTSCMLLAGGAVDLISVTNAYAVGESSAKYAAAAYVFSGILFFLICFPLSTVASIWEKNLKQRDIIIVEKAPVQTEVTDEELDELIQKNALKTSGSK